MITCYINNNINLSLRYNKLGLDKGKKYEERRKHIENKVIMNEWFRLSACPLNN